MKFRFLHLFNFCCLLCLSYAATAVETQKNKLVLNAVEDFEQTHMGQAPYYVDTLNFSLAIDARRLEYRNLFARATTIFQGVPATYDVSITTLTEEDGESLFRLLVNDTVVGTYRNTYIGEGSSKDLQPNVHTWNHIALKTGDKIGIESAAHTNGEIPENGGTAWARGRWQQLTLSPSDENSQGTRPHFNRHADLLLSQFDFQPDADDVHAVAALGSMLAHAEMSNINRMAVAGTVGIQGGRYIDASNLMSMAFGKEGFHWTNANTNWQGSVDLIRDRVAAVIAQGGKVWVQEAGQSDFTHDWLTALSAKGLSRELIKNNVIVVQHSDWNEMKTSPEALNYVKAHADYRSISDGNKPMRIFDKKNRRGQPTPIYVNADEKWLETAKSRKNTKLKARALWKEADKIIQKHGFTAKNSVIPKGGVDFSDHVEVWWIMDLGQPDVSVHSFWKKYVTDVRLDYIKPPKGRLAVVIDGNSPDPDDIGATPVIFGLLAATKLNDRLVHVSHSCDLDPARNKGYQISASDEERRQGKLYELSERSIKVFGPYKNLREHYNCRQDQAGATADLVDAINASTAKDPLWIIEAGEPDLIGYALQQSNAERHKHVHVVSHHPANDDSGDYFTWQQILDFGVTEHQIGDQNIGLQSPINEWDWAKQHESEGLQLIMEMLAYAEQDGVVPFQANKYDCSDAGMVYWWITGAHKGGNNFSSVDDVRKILLQEQN